MWKLPPSLVPVAGSLCLACSPVQLAQIEPIILTEIWRTSLFSAPESILPDPETGLFFVSNVNGEAGERDGNGFISRITQEGEIETLEWAVGMDAPKGMALVGDRLYVADIDQIVCLDRETGEIIARYPAPEAGFLNDAIAGLDGRVFVSDSANARIYVLAEETVDVWAEDPQLSSINGLWLEDDRMLTVTMDGNFAAIGLDGRNVELLGTGLGNGDALTSDGQGEYLSSEWPGQIYQLSPDGSFEVLVDSREADIYVNDFYRVGELLIIPHWQPGEVSGWRIQYGE
jgi:outer membrane protein assembly factor BamB